jgi:hypothetical protein
MSTRTGITYTHARPDVRQHIFHPEDRARATIDGQLTEAGWLV